ncbi:MAG TPA: hypothetical protein VGL35_02725 [Rhizomicrobium sp.]
MPLQIFLVAVLSLCACGAALADDQPFLTLDTTDIEPQFAHEFEQDFEWTRDPAAADGVQLESELEYGLYDDLQVAGAIDYGWERSGSGASVFHFTGAGGEALYRPWNVDFDPLGLGVFVSGSAGPDLQEIEGKLLLQKNFLNDRLRVVLNGGWIGDWERGAGLARSAWNGDSTLEWAAGLAFSITWEWSACLEFDNDRNVEGLLLDGKGTPGSSSYYLGPTIQYVAHPLTVSLGFQAQLPWASGGAPGEVQNGFATDSERHRIGLRVTRSF